MHFLALGFSSFPLQTHLRNVLTPASASLVASITPIAACMTYFFFRFAEARGWARSPRWVLFCAAVGVSLMQLMLGWRMHHASIGNFVVGPIVDVAMCLLLLGCVQSSVMTLLNHIGVATMGDYAYSVRAAGSAGYMAALLLMGTLSQNAEQVADYHLFIGATISVVHSAIAFLAWFCLPNQVIETHQVASPARSHASASPAAKSRWTNQVEWVGLLLLVWLVGICEMSYGLYAHEFLTNTYGNYGYFVFASAVAIEIGLLISMPFFPRLKKQLLFVGPLGWMILFTGCLLATQGWTAFGLCGLALALNCPFQISTNEHAHRMNPSVLGVASMTLAQSLGYTTATLISSFVSRFQPGPAILWMTVLPMALLALALAMWKLSREAPEQEHDDSLASNTNDEELADSFGDEAREIQELVRGAISERVMTNSSSGSSREGLVAASGANPRG